MKKTKNKQKILYFILIFIFLSLTISIFYYWYYYYNKANISIDITQPNTTVIQILSNKTRWHHFNLGMNSGLIYKHENYMKNTINSYLEYINVSSNQPLNKNKIIENLSDFKAEGYTLESKKVQASPLFKKITNMDYNCRKISSDNNALLENKNSTFSIDIRTNYTNINQESIQYNIYGQDNLLIKQTSLKQNISDSFYMCRNSSDFYTDLYQLFNYYYQ